MNQTILTGSLTRDSELIYATTGTAICKFSIAVNEYVKGEQKVQYFNIVSFSAEKLSTYLVKGTKVLISGKLQNSNYEKDGIKHYKTEVIASNFGGIELLGGKKAEGQDTNGSNNFGNMNQDNNFQEDIIPVEDGDMPF